MIDGKGRVRITDFGLAGFVDQFTGGEIRAGTPAYMAPEQLAGKGVSIRSDIYSLGLVLYELFTGKRAREGTVTELRDGSYGSARSRPSDVVDDISPAIERAILRCLEDDPRNRPSSALAVSAALPGGDPVAAALAAGETPSPEMVALGGEEGLLRTRTAVMLLLILFASMVGWFFLSDKIFLSAMAPLPKTPEQLEGLASDMLERLGFAEPYKDSAYGFEVDNAYIEYLKEKDNTLQRWVPLREERPSAVTFWYRRSPDVLVAMQSDPTSWQPIRSNMPPVVKPGMINLRVDPQGRLLELGAVPDPFSVSDEVIPHTGSSIWMSLFEEARLDMSRFQDASPFWRPRVAYDQRVAWIGTFDDQTDVPVRVEAATLDGRPVAFRILFPWQILQSATKPAFGQPPTWAIVLSETLSLAVIAFGGGQAWRNYRLGRGDRRGAFRYAIVAGALTFLSWMLYFARVSSSFKLVTAVLLGASFAVFWGGLYWALYLAAEPFVRRRLPDRMTSWTRLLSGRWRDPLVGRDLLIGATVGMALIVLQYGMQFVLASAFSLPGGAPQDRLLSVFPGVHGVAARILQSLVLEGLFFTLFLLVLVLIVNAAVRKLWLAVVAVGLLGVLMDSSLGFGSSLSEFLCFFLPGVVSNVVMLFLLVRLGMLGTATFFAVCSLAELPGAPNLTAWQAQPMLIGFSVIGALAVFGFYTSLAGRPLFKNSLGET